MGKISNLITSVTFLTAINSTFVFLTFLKFPVPVWACLNACAPSIYTYCVGTVMGLIPIRTIGAMMMFRFGTVGLFFFSWNPTPRTNLIVQFGHIMMTLCVIDFLIYLGRVYTDLKSKNKPRTGLFRSILSGIVLGACVLMFYQYQLKQLNLKHPEYIEALFKGNLEAQHK